MKTLLVIFCLFLFSVPIFAQKPHAKSLVSKSNAKISRKNIVKKKTQRQKIISMGVVNGRALSLPMPEYPPTAKAVGISGDVGVSVLIDTNGDVIDAHIISGHPLLRYSVLKAARESKFAPVIFSGIPTQVSGVIIYHFSMGIRNWVELGFILQTDSYSSRQEIADFLTKYEDSLQFFQQFKDANYETRAQIYESLLATIRGNLVNSPENSWRFEVGLAIGEVNVKGFGNEKENLEQLKTLVLNAPTETQNFFFEYFQNVVKLAEMKDLDQNFWQNWSKLISKIHSAQMKL